MKDAGKGLERIISRHNYQEKYAEMIAGALNDTDVQAFLNVHQEELTQMDIERSYAKLYEFVREKHKYQKNDPTMVAPGYKPKLTSNLHYVGVTYVPMEALSTLQRQEEIRSRAKAMDMPKNIQSTFFESFECIGGRGYTSLEALDSVEKYTADPKGYHEDLYLVGSLGIGRTYLLGATARELVIVGFVATPAHFPTFAVKMKQTIGGDQVAGELGAVRRSPILMIDNISADAVSNQIRDKVFSVILQYQMQEQLPTFFPSNFAIGELKQHLSVIQRGDEELLKVKRIVERIHYLTREVEMTGHNRRSD